MKTFIVLLLFCGPLAAQTVPTAIFTDPPADRAHPAAMQVLHIPSHGVNINGLIYSPPGAGPHPTLVICHGLPGNEKNLDLAQAVRRAGWNAVTFNYRGSWGSPGQFRFAHNPQDAAAVLAFLRSPANAAKYGIDTQRMVLAGHSMGGWVAALTGAHDPHLAGIILISMGDMSLIGAMPPDKGIAEMADNMEALAGVTAQSMYAEVKAHEKEFRAGNAAVGLSKLPLLALTSDDGLQSHTDDLVKAIKAAGGTRITAVHGSTDHGWSDHRIALETSVIQWLAALP
jgi:pimeloyl-ACP methyl ester carboxylesterase